MPCVVVYCPATPALWVYQLTTLSLSWSEKSCGQPFATVCFDASRVSCTCRVRMSTSQISLLRSSVCLSSFCRLCCILRICCCISWIYVGCSASATDCFILSIDCCAARICISSCLLSSPASVDVFGCFFWLCVVSLLALFFP